MLLEAHAKINLTLEVLARRDDGFHDIASILQAIDLADELSFEPAECLTVECDSPDITEENLVLRAAKLLQREGHTRQGARVRLVKRIPVAAGLGGGSSDAATALRGLSQLWRLELPPGRLAGLAAELGSDVPFFLQGGAAIATGRGEILSPLPTLPMAWFVLVAPPLGIANKTGALYRRLTRDMFTDGKATALLAESMRAGKPFSSDRFFNVFEKVATNAFAGLDAYMRRLEEAGARAVHLSGSGPSLFTLVGGQPQGRALVAQCQGLGLPAHLVRTVAEPV